MSSVKFIYDGPSLPMIQDAKHVYRVQVLDCGRWQSLHSEEEYERFFRECEMLRDPKKDGAI